MNAVENIEVNEERKGGDLSSFIRIFKYARPYWGELLFATIVLAGASFSGVLSARALGKLVEQGLVQKNLSVAFRLGVSVLAFEVGAIATSYFGRFFMARGSNSALLLIREKLFSHLNLLPMRYFDREPLGRTVTRMTYDVEGLEEFFGGTLARLLNAFLSIAVVATAMIATDVRLGTIILLAMLPAAAVTWLTRKPVRHWNREMARRNSAINARLAEFLNGIPVIRYFGAEKWSAERFDSVVDSQLEAALKINVLNSWVRPAVLILCAAPRVLLLYVGGKSVLAGELGVGVFVAFLQYTERFARPISAIAQEIQVVQAAFTSAERVARFLDHPTEETVLGTDGTHKPTTIQGAVEFRELTMAYEPGNDVLKEVSMKIAAGEKIGLAGRTGSGKTTTAALLSRLYEFQKGEIIVDGISIRDYRRDALRRHIGFVSQDVTIFRGSLFENLAFGAAISEAEVSEAARRTGLEKIMRGRELRLDSHLLDHGANLSAGERQLVALTRVLLRNPSLLILDEATSNVDEACEEILQEAVLSVMKGRTCLMIAHRLSTLEACDRILVFQGGRIVEEGAHAKLLSSNGYYAQLLKESSAPTPSPVEV